MFVWALIGVSASTALCFVAYLVFLGFVLVRTGDTAGFRDVAVAIQAFKRIDLQRDKPNNVEPETAEIRLASTPRVEADPAKPSA